MGTGSTVAIASTCALGAAALCGGVAAVQTTSSAPAAAPVAAASAADLTPAEAVRLAKQATFGPTPALVDRMVKVGLDRWLKEQFSATGSSYADLMARDVTFGYCGAKPASERKTCQRDYKRSGPVQWRFYADAVSQPDQLRQRVAWALSQLLVTAGDEIHTTAGVATFQQILLDGAFGNYRDLLKAVTLNPYMGNYLDLANSRRTAPNENYARELMQLFSMGVDQLNPDGTVKTDGSGTPTPAYTQADVNEVARALTGWGFAPLNGDKTEDSYAVPMIPRPGFFDDGQKSFLGRTVPAGAGQAANLDAVIDAVFSHANTAPYVSKFLIQQLVTANPSPAYVGRVARVFADNGAGVRGDLKAVVRAILTDAEARGPHNGEADGKVKEPVLLTTSLARLVLKQTDGYIFASKDTGMGQMPFEAPSVFNFYPKDYPLPQGGGLMSPASKLMDTGAVVARSNLVYAMALKSDASMFTPEPSLPGATGTTFDWSGWEAFGTDVDGQLDRLNLLLLNGAMTPAQRSATRAAMLAITDVNPAAQARRRAQAGLYVVASSPQFQVDR